MISCHVLDRLTASGIQATPQQTVQSAPQPQPLGAPEEHQEALKPQGVQQQQQQQEQEQEQEQEQQQQQQEMSTPIIVDFAPEQIQVSLTCCM